MSHTLLLARAMFSALSVRSPATRDVHDFGEQAAFDRRLARLHSQRFVRIALPR